ncbi:MAG: hypothetical protein ABEL76_05425 [Bradymonadaceae bacterium]
MTAKTQTSDRKTDGISGLPSGEGWKCSYIEAELTPEGRGSRRRAAIRAQDKDWTFDISVRRPEQLDSSASEGEPAEADGTADIEHESYESVAHGCCDRLGWLRALDHFQCEIFDGEVDCAVDVAAPSPEGVASEEIDAVRLFRAERRVDVEGEWVLDSFHVTPFTGDHLDLPVTLESFVGLEETPDESVIDGDDE